jgi:hypothetical protein
MLSSKHNPKKWNNKNQRRGATVLLEVLRSEAARYVFGNPGTTELPLIEPYDGWTRPRLG